MDEFIASLIAREGRPEEAVRRRKRSSRWFRTPPLLRVSRSNGTHSCWFTSGDDPIKIGLVSSLNRPGANVTGVSILLSEVQAKRLELLSDLIPTAKAVGFVFDPDTPREEVEPAARRLDLEVHAISAAAEDELDAAFAAFTHQRLDAVLVGAAPRLFNGDGASLRSLPAPHCLGFTSSVETSRRRRVDQLRSQHCGRLSSSWDLRGEDFEGR